MRRADNGNGAVAPDDEWGFETRQIHAGQETER